MRTRHFVFERLQVAMLGDRVGIGLMVYHKPQWGVETYGELGRTGICVGLGRLWLFAYILPPLARRHDLYWYWKKWSGHTLKLPFGG